MAVFSVMMIQGDDLLVLINLNGIYITNTDIYLEWKSSPAEFTHAKLLVKFFYL